MNKEYKDILEKCKDDKETLSSHDRRTLRNKKTILDMYEGPPLNKAKAIHTFCLDCSGGQNKEVYLCPAYDCPLYPYRFGKNPYSNRAPLGDEQKAVLSDQLRRGRETTMKLRKEKEGEENE